MNPEPSLRKKSKNIIKVSQSLTKALDKIIHKLEKQLGVTIDCNFTVRDTK